MDLVGVDHSEDVEDIEERVPKDNKEYDRLFHEDFNSNADLETIGLLKKIILTPVYFSAFFILIFKRFVARSTRFMSQKADWKFRKNSKIDKEFSIDADPFKLVEMHEIGLQEAAINWLYIILIFNVFYVLGNLGIQFPTILEYSGIQYSYLLVIKILVIGLFLVHVYFSWFCSLDERDRHMSREILKREDSDKQDLVVVGDLHVPGMYTILSDKLDKDVNTYRVDNLEV